MVVIRSCWIFASSRHFKYSLECPCCPVLVLSSCSCVVLLFLVSLFFSFLWWGRLSAPFQKMATNAIFTEMELAPPVILNRLCSTAKKVTVSARWVQFQGQTATASCQEKLGFMVIATLLYYYISFSQLLK